MSEVPLYPPRAVLTHASTLTGVWGVGLRVVRGVRFGGATSTRHQNLALVEGFVVPARARTAAMVVFT